MNPRARLAFAGMAAAAVIVAAAATWWRSSGWGADPAISLREVAVRGLAEHLARQFPGQRVLVLGNPFSAESRQPKSVRAIESASVRALQRGLGEANVVVAFPELRPGARENPQAFVADPETTTPLSFLLADGAIDTLTGRHPDCRLIVSLIGLPVSVTSSAAWTASAGPKFALLLPDLRVIGDTAAIRAAVQSGKLPAFVLNKPGATGNADATDARAVAGGRDRFDHEFVLVTPENFDAISRAHPGLFEATGALAR